MQSDLENWLGGKGAIFLRKIGLQSGDRVLDFGCGPGHYSIPATQVVGMRGKVYSLDKDGEVLQKLRKQAQAAGLLNIRTDRISGELKINFPDETFDAILAYDVLHYLERREELLSEFHRTLKKEGFFSVYPKHRVDDHPLSNLARLSLEEIIEEIRRFGFILERQSSEELLHDESLNRGVVLKFVTREVERRKRRENGD